MKFKIKLTALILAIIMVICAVPFNVIAQADAETQNDMTPAPQDEGLTLEEYSTEVIEYVEDEIIGEVVEAVEMREENVKHFRLSNGTYEAVVYPRAVHRKIDGEWKDIDNNLSIQTVKNIEIYSTSDNRVSFAKSFSLDSQIFTLSENGYTISMGLISDRSPEIGIITPITPPIEIAAAENSTALQPTVTNAAVRQDRFDSLDAAVQIDNKASLKYPSVIENVDLEYVLDGNDVKENIIIKGIADEYEYSFTLNTDGLYAVLDEDGAVSLLDEDTGRRRYTIPAPFMYDASGTVSYDVSYTLSGDDQNGYILTVNADAEWINSSDRVFPVTVDPSITYGDYDFFDDTFISPLTQNANYGGLEHLYVSQKHIALIKAYTYGIPAGATINEAVLKFSYYYQTYQGNLTIGAYQLLADWDEYNITWNIAASQEGFLATSPTEGITVLNPTTVSSITPGTAEIDITSAFRSWHENSYSNNYGVALKYMTGSSYSKILVHAYESANAPLITVSYTYFLPDGVYGIKNSYTPTISPVWIRGRDGAGYNIQQEMLSTSPVESFTRANLFKISRITDTNRYVIRSMYNNKLSFNYTADGGIVMKEIPVNDAEVSENDCFVIEYAFNGFKIRPYNSDKYITGDALIYDGILQSVEPDLYAGTDGSTWEFVQYTGAHKQGSIIYYSSSWRSVGFIVGDTSSISTKTYSTRINYNTPYLEVDSTCLPLVTGGDLPSNVHSITVTAVNPGSLKFNFKVLRSADEAIETVTTGYAYYNIVPKAGYYFIQGVGNKKYIDIEYNSTASGADLQQYEFTTGNTLRWTIEHVPNSNGYVRIKSVHSGMYMGVESSVTTKIRQYSTPNDYTLWRVQYCSSGNLRFICKATESTGYVLAAPTSTENSADLEQILYVDDLNYKDEWAIYSIKYITHVNNYYDMGYVVRYGETASVSEDKIDEYTKVVAERYLQLLGLLIVPSAPQYYQSPIDLCKGTVDNNNIDSMCAHSGLLHTNDTSVLGSFNSTFVGNNQTTNVLWSGHRIIYVDADGNPIYIEGKPVYNRSFSYNEIVVMLVIEEILRDSVSKGVLMHELAHQFGARDHYHETTVDGDDSTCKHKDICSWCGDNPRPESCIMNNSRVGINNQNVICSECMQDILNHLNSHHIYS